MADEDQGLSASPKTRDQKYCDPAAICGHAGQPQAGLIASVLTNRLMLIHTNRFVCFGQVRSSTARTLKRRPDEGLVGGEDRSGLSLYITTAVRLSQHRRK